MLIRSGSRVITILTLLAAGLALLATAAGLLIPGFYDFLADQPALLAGSLAQDASVLVITLLMLAGLWRTRRGSARGLVLWAAGLAYLIYSYLIYAFDPVYTTLYPAYIAILSLSIFALIGLLGKTDVQAFRLCVDERLPVRLLAVVLGSLLVLVPVWLAQIAAALRAQTVSPFNSIYVIDLTMVIPASLLAAVWLWQRRDGGYLLAGIMLAKFGLMGTYLALGTLWLGSMGLPYAPMELAMWLFLALVGGGSFLIYLRHVHGPGVPSPATKRSRPADIIRRAG